MRALPPSWSFVAAALISLAGACEPVSAQTVSLVSVTSNSPALGILVSANNATDTVFRVAAADGSVTKISGGGVRVTTGTTRALVTMTCTTGAGKECERLVTRVTISAAGSPTGRARALTNFTVAPGPNPPTMGTVTSTLSNISFDVSGIVRATTVNFYVGADFAIEGATGGATGLSHVEFHREHRQWRALGPSRGHGFPPDQPFEID